MRHIKKLLILTQRVDRDDENLGAFSYWFEEFAKRFEKVTILVSERIVPLSVEPFTVHSFGKEKGYSRIRRLWKLWELFSYHYSRSDAVLFHQIPEFVLATSPFLISLRRPSALWYAHKSVTWRLKLAERMVDYILTSSQSGFRFPSKKVHVVGQAINTELFHPPAASAHYSPALRMVSVGRISPVKNYETLIHACSFLKEKLSHPWMLSIVGGPLVPKDQEYMQSLKRLVVEKGLERYIFFHGPQPFSDIPNLLREHDLFINLSSTGSLDKAVLEAMASGLSVITANEAYRSLLPARYFLDHMSPEFLAERIALLADENRPNMALRAIVEERHSLRKTVEKIISILSQPL